MVTTSNFGNEKAFKSKNYSTYVTNSLCQFRDLIQIFVYYVKTRTPPIYCYPIATVLSFLMISKTHVLEDAFMALGVSITSYCLALATYVYNDITDKDIDQINRREQSIMAQNQSKNKLIILIVTLFSFSVMISYAISSLTFLISLTFITLGILYSHPKFSLKSKFPLKTVVTAAGAGLLSMLGGVAAIDNGAAYDRSISTTIFPLSTIYMAISFSIFYFIQSPLGDIADIKGDRAAGRNTFPIVLGMNKTLAVMVSVPFIILTMNGLFFSIMHISIHGTVAIVSSCLLVVGFIGWISNRLHDPIFVKSKRNNVRYLNILMQVTVLIALI